MSTRSIVRFYNSKGKYLGGYWRHWDGYPSAHGVDLVEAIRTLSGMVDNLTIDQLKDRLTKGFSLLRGDIDPIEQEYPNGWQEYAYDIRPCEKEGIGASGFHITIFTIWAEGRDKKGYYKLAEFRIGSLEFYDLFKQIKNGFYDLWHNVCNKELQETVSKYYDTLRNRCKP